MEQLPVSVLPFPVLPALGKMLCKKGHHMSLVHLGTFQGHIHAYMCDRCEREMPRTEPRFSCDTEGCDWDVCCQCSTHDPGSASIIEPVAIAGALPSCHLQKTGITTTYLAGVRKGRFPHVVQLAQSSGEEPVSPAFSGTISEFLVAHRGDASLTRKCQNKIKKCTSCGKACAFTLRNCNACGANLLDTPISFNENVFMGFVFGIAQGNFPFTISMRSQSSEYLCFDDPLALTAAHLNVIPTSTYIPDWRFLLLNPTAGLHIIDSMFETCARVLLEQFWGNTAFRSKYFAGEPDPSSWQELRGIVNAGMNYPPSMYQLHLQFMHPPWLPFQYQMLTQENHLHYRRYFCLEYVRAVLERTVELPGGVSPVRICEDTDINLVIEAFDNLGVKYDDFHSQNVRRTKAMQERFASFDEGDFEFIVAGGTVLSKTLLAGVTLEVGKDPKEIQKLDAKLLNSYGRPFDEATGKSKGQFYKFAKTPAEVKEFGTESSAASL